MSKTLAQALAQVEALGTKDGLQTPDLPAPACELVSSTSEGLEASSMNRLLPVVTASMVVWSNPLIPPTQGRPIGIGTPLRDLAPATQSPLMLRVNGQWLLRADWWRPVLPGDVIEWYELPQGGGQGSRTILSLVAMVAISYFTMGAGAGILGPLQGTAAAAGIGIGGMIAAQALINALIPVQQAGGSSGQSPGSVYNVALSANQARLNQPIKVGYGRMLDYPDYGAQPYTEFDENNDQYFYALYCIGQGNYTIERVQIDDTEITHFQDVQYRILPPGTAPSTVLANVSTAPEVSGQDMKTGLYIGGFAACGPQLKAASIGIDIVFPRGLALADSGGSLGNISASFRVEVRDIDDFGVHTSNWRVLATETVTKSTSEPVRISRKYSLTYPYRVEVRLVRTDNRNTNIRALHDMTWAGLRAYLDEPAPLSSTCTHMEVKVRASEQLSGLSQRKIGVIWRRLLRTWSQGGGWGPEVETRNPMWARLDKLTNAVYGDDLPDNRIDLVTHETLAAIADARQDRFDHVFDSKITSIDADRIICASMRSAPFQRGGVCTVTRDQQQTLPVTAFTSRDIQPGTMSIGYALATEVTADGVIVEYFNNRAWDWREILCPAPGVAAPVRATRVRLIGITGPKHAEREGKYQAAQNVYRRKFPKFTTEMQGLLPAYGSPVLFAPALPGWGQAGDVAFWNPTTKVMGLTEPVAFTPGAQHFISIRRDDGSISDPISATPGPTEYDVVLASNPKMSNGSTDMTMVLDDANRERPKYIFGASGQHRIMVRVLGISKRGRSGDGAPMVEISTVAEDDRVHLIDNALLPSPGEVQDPVLSSDEAGDTAGGGSTGDGATLVLVSLSDGGVSAGNTSNGDGISAGITFNNDGTLRSTLVSAQGTLNLSHSGQWVSAGVVEVAQAALFEIRATRTFGTSSGLTGTLGSWLNLGTTRTWTYLADMFEMTPYMYLFFEIREISSGIIVDSATVVLQVNNTAYGLP